MPDPPPYGFRQDHMPYGGPYGYEGAAPPYNYANVSLSYPMPLPQADADSGPIFMHKEILDGSSDSSSNHSDEAGTFQLDYTMYPPVGHCWQALSVNEPFPISNAVRAGKDQDGCTIYVGRAIHNGDMLPAKIIPDKNVAYVSYDGEEVPKEDFEILRQGDFVWEFATNGEIPEGAVAVGRTAEGEKLFMGRCLYQGTQTPGKLHPSHGCLYIPFDGEEIAVHEYEVLVVK